MTHISQKHPYNVPAIFLFPEHLTIYHHYRVNSTVLSTEPKSIKLPALLKPQCYEVAVIGSYTIFNTFL